MTDSDDSKTGRRKSLLDFLKLSKIKNCNILKNSKSPSLDQASTSDEDNACNQGAPPAPAPVMDVPDHVHTPPPMRGRSMSHCGPIDSLHSAKFDREVRDRLRRISEQPIEKGGGGKPCKAKSDDTLTMNAHKQTHFHEDVDVFHHDAEGKLAFKNCVRLKQGDARWRYPGDGVPPGSNDTRRVPNSRKHIFPVEDVEVRWKPNGKKYLRLVINLGRKLADGKISLRALKDGSKLILTVQKMEPLGDGTEFLRQYVDRFILPQPICSENIEAIPQANGWLLVDALLLDCLD